MTHKSINEKKKYHQRVQRKNYKSLSFNDAEIDVEAHEKRVIICCTSKGVRHKYTRTKKLKHKKKCQKIIKI